MTLPGVGAAAVLRAAPAKLNLYLHVVGRRPADGRPGAGYHELDSLVAFADVHDTVAAAPADALSLSLSGPFAGALAREADNLVLGAARALAAAAGIAPAARLVLAKRLPVASGIGGGSADAAAALSALASLWRLDLAPGRLAEIALALGADVPVCLAGRAAQMSGIGEIVRPAVSLPPAGLVLVNPGVALPTPSVFAARRGDFDAPAPLDRAPESAAALAAALRRRRNGLTAAAIGLVPEIAEVLAALEGAPGCLLARMSGSGATCFGLFADKAAADAATAALARGHRRWWMASARLVADTAAIAPDTTGLTA
jgi:4-diphosphocytidyl-2-C-methyl-D-erythritol kinase